MKLFRTFLSVALFAAATLCAQAQESTAGYYATVELQNQDTVLYIKHYETKPEVGETILYVNENELSTWNNIIEGVNSGYEVNIAGEGWREPGYVLTEHIKRAILQVGEDFKPQSTASWFNSFTNLEAIEGLENLNTASVANMSYMFSKCSTLTNLDVSNFNTEQVTDMSNMFEVCKSLTNLDVSNFNTEKVTNMNYMFRECSSLKSLELGKEFTASVATSMVWTFGNLYNIEALDLSDLKTETWQQVGAFIYGTYVPMFIREFKTTEEIESSDFSQGNKIFVGPESSVGKEFLRDYYTKKVNEAGDIELGILPEKLKYKIGEALDLTGGFISLKVKYDNDEGEEVIEDIPLQSLSGLEKKITGFDNKTSGKKTLSVPYKGETYTFEVEVEEDIIAIESVSLNPKYLAMKIGDKQTITATINPTNASKQDLTWKSLNDEVASVVDGEITAKAVGETEIVVLTNFGDKSDTCKVLVSEIEPETVAVDSIVLSQNEATIRVGESLTLTAKIFPENATNQKIIWETQNPYVASVDNGVVKALNTGVAMIYAYSAENSEIKAECRLEVEYETALEVVAKNEVLVYPNPAFDVINFSAEVEYQIFGFAGNCVLQGVGSVANVSELPRGLYVVEYNYNGARAAKKVVLK